jgi:DNA repair exonuclease SbcCD nuclease subunit
VKENLVLVGDPHLGGGLNQGKQTVGSILNSRVVDRLNLLDWSLDYAVEHHADIVLTGDCFEEPCPKPNLIALFISWIKKCEAYDTHIHIILGNHDFLRSGNVYNSSLDILVEAELKNVSVYKDTNTFFLGTTSFTMMPFRDRKSFNVSSNQEAILLLRDSLVYELASIPETYHKVIVGHFAIEGSIPVGDEIDDLTNELFCPISMFAGFDYIWMGHVHKPQIMNKQNPFVAHIGSMDVSNFGETDHHKHIVLFDAINHTWTTENLPTRSLKKINIVVPENTEDATEYVRQSIEKEKGIDGSIIRIEVSFSSASEQKSINKTVIEKYLGTQGAFHIAGISESKKISLVKKDLNNTIDTKMDVGIAINTYANSYVEEKYRPDFISLASEIYAEYKLEAKD